MAFANQKITVSIQKVGTKPNTKLQFKFTPPKLDVSEKGRVTWTSTGSNKFTFAALAFYERNPFSSVVVHKDTNSISALDHYYGQGAVDEGEVEYHYSVLVKLDDGTYVNSEDCRAMTNGGSPTIRNK